MRHELHASQVDWPFGVFHGSTPKAHGSKHVIVGTLVYWLVLGPSNFSVGFHTVVFCFFHFFLVFFCSILLCARENDKEKGTHPHFDVPVSPYPWVDAIVLTRWVLLPPRWAAASGPSKQPSCATSGSKQPETVDMPAVFISDSRCLLIFIYSRLCSGRGGTIVSTYRRWSRWCHFLLVLSHKSSLSFSHLCL